MTTGKKIETVKIDGVPTGYVSAKTDFTTDAIQFDSTDTAFSLHVDAQANIAVTLTGTGGTANIVVDGVEYLATFDTDLTTTASNFVTAHAAALLADSEVYAYANAGVITFTGEKELLEDITADNLTLDLDATFGSITYTIDGTANITIKASNDLDAPFQNFDNSYVNINVATAGNRMINRTAFPFKYMKISYDATTVNVGAFRMFLYK